MKTSLVPALVAATVLSPFALADTLSVPSQFETIQDAIDAAAAGDTVSISSGNYTENLVIPVGLDGLTLTGKGKVWINAQTSGDGITIASSNVTITKLGIRHADGDGIRTGSPGDGGPDVTFLTVSRVTIVNSSDAGIDASSDDCVVENCLLYGNGDGLQINGDRALVKKTTVRNDCDEGIDISGDDARVENCLLTANEDAYGITISGDRPFVIKNRIVGADDAGIDISSNGPANVENNQIETVDDTGINVNADPAIIIGNTLFAICDDAIVVSGGTEHRIEKNRIAGIDGNGIDVSGDDSTITKNAISATCDTAIEAFGDGIVITANRISGVSEDEDGIVLSGPIDGKLGFNVSRGATIEKNRIEDVTEYGMELRVIASLIAKNTLTNCGSEDEGGIFARGDSNTFEKNTLKIGDGSGIEVDGNMNLVVKNRISDFTDNGILIDGSDNVDNVVEGNSVTNNHGDGIENESIDTVLRGNKMKGNLQDLSNVTGNGASYIDDGGNKFDTGGLTAEPLID